MDSTLSTNTTNCFSLPIQSEPIVQATNYSGLWMAATGVGQALSPGLMFHINTNQIYTSSILDWYSCCYYNCGASNQSRPNLRLYSFPLTNPVLFRKWAINSGNPAFLKLSVEELQNKMLCEKHFLLNRQRILPKLAVPFPYITRNDYAATSSDESKCSRFCKCEYYNCGKSSKTHPGLRFFKFPVDDVVCCTRWIENSGNRKFSKLSEKELSLKRLCQLHFDEMYLNNSGLNLNVVPKHYKHGVEYPDIKTDNQIEDYDCPYTLEDFCIKVEADENFLLDTNNELNDPINKMQDIENQKDTGTTIFGEKKLGEEAKAQNIICKNRVYDNKIKRRKKLKQMKKLKRKNKKG